MQALHTAATGMAAQELSVQVISNNIANLQTTGYKKQTAEFQDLIYEHVRRVGPLGRGNEDRWAVGLPEAPLDQIGQNLPAPRAARPEYEINQGLVIRRAQKLKILFWEALRIQWSTRTSAAIASTMGTALGRTHGSWRPRPFRVVF